jgi:2''-5'' RNA ligase
MIFPRFENMDAINKIRDKYDPLASHVRPHITLVFPFNSELQYKELNEHLKNALSSINPFEVTLKGFTPVKSFGNHLFLNIAEGGDKIIEIHKKLYTGILEPYMPQWLKEKNFLPHMTVGNMEDENEYKAAIDEVSNINDAFRTVVTKISVENIDANEDSIIEMEVDLK